MFHVAFKAALYCNNAISLDLATMHNSMWLQYCMGRLLLPHVTYRWLCQHMVCTAFCEVQMLFCLCDLRKHTAAYCFTPCMAVQAMARQHESRAYLGAVTQQRVILKSGTYIVDHAAGGPPASQHHSIITPYTTPCLCHSFPVYPLLA